MNQRARTQRSKGNECNVSGPKEMQAQTDQRNCNGASGCRLLIEAEVSSEQLVAGS